MKNFFSNLLKILGGITLVGILYVSGLGIYFWVLKGQISPKTILEVNFERELIEYVPDNPPARLILGRSPTLRDIIDGLETASKDERVIGIIARIGQVKMGFAQIQEIRDAIRAFRSKGKKAVAYTDTFGEFGPANGAYYLATAFEKIYLQPSGDIGLTGLMFETQFVKGTLDKLGIIPRMDHRQEYKNAMNTFTEKKYTDPHREALEKVMTSLFDQLVTDIVKSRKLSQPGVCSLIDQGPFYGEEAVTAKLVDGLAYQDEVYETVKKEAGEDASLLYLSKYISRADHPYKKGKKIALIYGVGGIHRGESQYNPLFGDMVMGSHDVAAAFHAAIEDKDVKAILFRVNSPGGSYVASDTIWRETIRAKEAEKPIIVSMSNVAGSGGYFISMAADKIVAQPGTITGSIGVFAGKMVTSEFLNKLGISSDEIHTSSNASMWSDAQDYTPEQWERLQNALDRIYKDFTHKVAEGRNLPPDKVLEIAKGRIWTGEDAKMIGLVDELGGFPTALRLAKKAADIPEDSETYLEVFPKKKSIVELILKRDAESSEEESTEASIARELKKIQPLLQKVRQLEIWNNPEVLSMQMWDLNW